MVSTSTTTTGAVSSSTVRIPTLTRTGCTGDDAAYFPSARITIDSNRCESTFLVCKVFISSFFCVFLTDLILNSLLPPEPPASDLINARCVCMHFVMCYGDKNGDSNCLLLFIHFYLFFLQVLPLFWLRWTPSQNGNRLQPILFVVRFIYQRASTFRSFTYWSRLKQNVVFFVNYNSIFFNGMVGAFNERPNHRTHCNCMRYIHGR